MPDVDRGWHRQQTAERLAKALWPVDRVEVREIHPTQSGRNRRGPEPDAALPVKQVGEVCGGRPIALGLQHPRQQLLQRLLWCQLQQLLLVARQHQARLQLQQRRDQHQELGGELQVQLTAGLEHVEIAQHDVCEIDLEQIHLVPQDERQQQVERPGEDLEVQLEISDMKG